MKTFEFDEDEVGMLMSCLNIGLSLVSTTENQQKIKAIYKKIAPKKVTKQGWVVVYPDRSIAGVYDTEERARQQRLCHTEGQIIQITWEQEE